MAERSRRPHACPTQTPEEVVQALIEARQRHPSWVLWPAMEYAVSGDIMERSTLAIAERAIPSLIQTQDVGDLYRIYLTAQRDGVDYNLAYILPRFNAPHRQDFDTEYIAPALRGGIRNGGKGLPVGEGPAEVHPFNGSRPAG